VVGYKINRWDKKPADEGEAFVMLKKHFQ